MIPKRKRSTQHLPESAAAAGSARRAWLPAALWYVAAGALLVGGLAACAGPSGSAYDYEIEVEGMVSLRGNTPFEAYMLETDSRNVYVLSFEGERPALARTARYRAVGQPYSEMWGDRKMAFLRVARIDEIDG